MRLHLLVALLASAGLLTQPAEARSRDQRQGQQAQETRRDAGGEDRRDHRGDRAADAARKAQQRNGGGRVLSVEPEGAGHRVKVLKDGEVRTHHVED